MTNLIPPDAKKAIRREYVIRVTSVVGLLIGIACTVVALTATPIYASLSFQLDGLRLENAAGDDTTEAEYTEAVAAIESANTLASQLGRPGVRVKASRVLEEAASSLNGDITLTGFSYTAVPGREVGSVTVEGTAATRAALAGFKDALERKPLFARADVPVSSLAENVDLPFTITLVVSDIE